jgi:hypothetical protein
MVEQWSYSSKEICKKLALTDAYQGLIYSTRHAHYQYRFENGLRTIDKEYENLPVDRVCSENQTTLVAEQLNKADSRRSH